MLCGAGSCLWQIELVAVCASWFVGALRDLGFLSGAGASSGSSHGLSGRLVDVVDVGGPGLARTHSVKPDDDLQCVANSERARARAV